MNMQQFKTLEVDDEVENALSHSKGLVTKATAQGVHIAWGGNAHEFFYSVSSTAWYHWNNVAREARPVDHGSGGNV